MQDMVTQKAAFKRLQNIMPCPVISALTGFIILRAGGQNELKIVKSQKPYKKKRAYFKELTTIMVAKNLVDKPNRIINIDE